MFFDLTNDAQRRQFREYTERMLKKGATVRLDDMTGRTLEQNSYYQLLIAYFASRTGHDLRWVRDAVVKQAVCPDIFVRDGRLRSSSELTADEMQTVISRFLYFSDTVAGVPLPDADDRRAAITMARQVRQDRFFLPQPELKWKP